MRWITRLIDRLFRNASRRAERKFPDDWSRERVAFEERGK